jgi:tetratricopeptide (TPR) repeat protein
MLESPAPNSSAQELNLAEAQCRQSISLNPRDPSLHFQLANLLCQKNLPLEALAAFSDAIKSDVNFAAAYSGRGSLFGDLKAFNEAIADHRNAVRLAPANITFRLALVQTLQTKGDLIQAENDAHQALEIDPNSAALWESLGRILQTVGRFDEAARCLRRAMDIEPSGRVGVLLSRMPRQSESTDVQKVINLLESADLAPTDRISAGFAMANALDENNRFDEAFAAYATANAQFKKLSAERGQCFDLDHLRQFIDQMITTYTAGYFLDRLDFGQNSELPVFIVGMPRSGTSLVEQIVASHSQVFGGGELQDIGLIHARLSAIDPKESPRHWHRHLARVHLARLAAMGGNAARVTDKMPANLMHLGLIATLFPGARVIFCQRDPRDTCLSCFFQLFAKTHQLFSYDLIDCGGQYRQQQRLTDHWKQVLPIQMLTVDYEALIADFERQSRRLIDFLGLAWEPACLEYHRTARPVLTMSSWQVRQPIYSRSVGRWRNYASHLSELEKVLNDKVARV